MSLLPSEIRRGWVGKTGLLAYSGAGASPDPASGSDRGLGGTTNQMAKVAPDGHVKRANQTVVIGVNRGNPSDRPHGLGKGRSIGSMSGGGECRLRGLQSNQTLFIY